MAEGPSNKLVKKNKVWLKIEHFPQIFLLYFRKSNFPGCFTASVTPPLADLLRLQFSCVLWGDKVYGGMSDDHVQDRVPVCLASQEEWGDVMRSSSKPPQPEWVSADLLVVFAPYSFRKSRNGSNICSLANLVICRH